MKTRAYYISTFRFICAFRYPKLFLTFLLFFCSDLEKIYKGIGDNLALLIQWTSTFFAAFGVGLFRDWRLALVLLGVTPFMALSGGVFAKVRVCVCVCVCVGGWVPL